MNPSEKAKWLIEEMKGGCCRCPNDSKYAAITCVDEILSAFEEAKKEGVYFGDHMLIYHYWQQVKKHIETHD